MRIKEASGGRSLYLVRNGRLWCLSVFLLDQLVSSSAAAAAQAKSTVAEDDGSFTGLYFVHVMHSANGFVVYALSLCLMRFMFTIHRYRNRLRPHQFNWRRELQVNFISGHSDYTLMQCSTLIKLILSNLIT